ncbi:O-methyltransferase [Salibacterium aidingense]|uniref:O-methyltransferase n=1 Tax=Salibacterium aidingense TaxID=384933 RepID=UPI0004217D7B|nr:O-methyltransferase [Salibacterium aidingense]
MQDKKLLLEYMESFQPKNHTLFRDMESFAEQDKVPIMEKDALEVMLQLLQLHNSRRILEIGTAIGYSALRMAQALPQAHIVSLEKDEIRHKQALNYRELSGLQTHTTFYLTDALEESFSLESPEAFDVLFIDAAKGKYLEFFEKYTPYVKRNGLVITDNVFFKGLTATPEKASKRLLPMVQKIRTFNQMLAETPSYQTRFLPVGDGLAVSMKVENDTR